MLHDPDRWLECNSHWHGYVEISSGGPFEPVSTRDERLKQAPDKVLMSPDAVAQWLAEMTREHAHPEEIHFLNGVGSKGNIGDSGHIQHITSESLEVLHRGDSLYYDFRRKDDRMRLWAEAVTECREGHT